MRRILCVLFVLLTGPIALPDLAGVSLAAPVVASASSQAAAPAVAPVSAAPAPAAATPNLAREADAALADAPLSRLDVLMSGIGLLVAMFGALITAVIVFFAFNIKEASVAGATLEVMKDREALHEMIEKVRAQMEQAVTLRTHLQGEVSEFKLRAEEQFREIYERLDEADAVVEDIEEKGQRAIEKLEARAERPFVPPAEEAGADAPAAPKDIREYDDGDFRRAIAEAASRGDLDEVRDLAVVMQRMLADDRPQAFARFAEGWALDETNEGEKSISAYDRLVAHYGASDDPEVQEWVAKALFNKGASFGTQGKNDEAIACYNDLVERFGSSTVLELRALVARALVNKGNRYEVMGQSGEAQAVYQGVVERFSDAEEWELRRQVAFALYNLAAIAGRQGEKSEAVALLRQWIAMDPHAAAYSLHHDNDFDPVRDDPRFRALVAELEAQAQREDVTED
jgi:tetratricopeptide (TPR) repeat protein